MAGASTPFSFYGWYFFGIGAFALLISSLATTYWGQKEDEHFGLFSLCDEDGCRTFENVNTIEGRLCIFSAVVYGLELIFMTIFFAAKRNTETSKRWQYQAGIVLLGAIITFVSVGIFVGEMNSGLSEYSYGKSFYIAVASGVSGLIAGIMLNLAINHYLKYNIQESAQNGPAINNAFSMEPTVSTTGGTPSAAYSAQYPPVANYAPPSYPTKQQPPYTY